jgi:hypothetical protein
MIFGKAIQRNFIAYEDQDPVAISSLSPAIYLFDTQPTLANAANGIGAIQSIAAWINLGTNSPYVNTYSFNAVSDPEPTGNVTTRDYWEAINYKIDPSATIAPLIRSFEISRAVGGMTDTTTKIADLKGVFPAISQYLSDSQLSEVLENAEEQLKLDLSSNDLNWSQIGNLNALRLTLAYLAIAMSSETQFIATGADRFERRATLYRNLYSENLKKIKLTYDKDKDGSFETVKKAGAFSIQVQR